jgi:hypothetical protein
MTALIQQGLTSLFAAEDRNQRWRSPVILSEVTAEPTLSVMKRLHSVPPCADVRVGAGAVAPELLCMAAEAEKSVD